MKEQQLKGTIKYWNGRKGFGFLEPEGDGDGKQIFVHIKAFSVRKNKPSIGLEVYYDLSTDEQGRFRADNVMTAEELALKKNTSAMSKSSIIIIVVSFMIVISTYFLN